MLCIMIPLYVTSVLCEAMMAQLGLGIKVATYGVPLLSRVAHRSCRQKLLPGALRNAFLVIGGVVVLTCLGHGFEVLMLWFIPARITMMIFGFVFFWLPHANDDVSAQENLTLATGMRFQHEWLLGPALQFHNYHLLHHLWPSTPPYLHPKVWRLMEPEIRHRRLAVQKGFSIYPTVVEPGQPLR